MVTVSVDRTIKPGSKNPLPEGYKPLYSNSEKMGPEEYSLSDILFIPFQMEGRLKPRAGDVARYLRRSGLLVRSFSLLDLEEIQSLRPNVFAESFGENTILYAFKSAVLGPNNRIFAPFLCLQAFSGGKIIDNLAIGWTSGDAFELGKPVMCPLFP